MSFEALAWAVGQDLKHPIRKLMLIAMANSANPDNDNKTWHSRKTLAQFCGVSTRSISAHMRWLEDHGYVTFLDESVRNGTNMYRINVGLVEVQKGPRTLERDSTPPLKDVQGGLSDVQPPLEGGARGGCKRFNPPLQEIQPPLEGGATNTVIETVNEPVSETIIESDSVKMSAIGFLDRLVSVHDYEELSLKRKKANRNQAKQWIDEQVSFQELDDAVQHSRDHLQAQGETKDPPIAYIAKVIASNRRAGPAIKAGPKNSDLKQAQSKAHAAALAAEMQRELDNAAG